MALATKCPQCGALFRVVADQLKLRGGLVRCGQCRSVFDAIGSLTYVDETALPQPRPVAPSIAKPAPPRGVVPVEKTQPSAPTTRPAAPAPLARVATLRIPPPAPAVPAPAPLEELNTVPGGDDDIEHIEMTMPADFGIEAELSRVVAGGAADRERLALSETGVPTLIAPSFDAKPEDEAKSQAEIEAQQRRRERRARHERQKVEAQQAGPARAAEPEFIRAAARSGQRGFSIIFGGGSALLAVLALLQLGTIYRTELLIRWPQLRPQLQEVCAITGCSVGWPAQADQLAVLSSELQALPGTEVLELTTVIRNRAAYRLALPAFEVSLSDVRDKPLVRKVFSPADYLAAAGEPSSRIEEGLAPGSDYTVKIYLEARGVQAAGFLVYPFFL